MKFIGCIFLIIFGTVNSQDTCSDGEVLACKNECQPTCAEPTPSPSINCYVCEEGCICKPNLLRDTEINKCIPPSDCPKNGTRCEGENEQFDWCASWCPKTCQSPCREPVFCIQSCKEACVCKPGFIRDEISSKCVEPFKCPSCKCRENEMWTQCNAGCEKTCTTVKKPSGCVPDIACSPGCICAKGFIRKERGGKCIPSNKCFS